MHWRLIHVKDVVWSVQSVRCRRLTGHSTSAANRKNASSHKSLLIDRSAINHTAGNEPPQGQRQISG